jgi:aspartate racemase
MKTIGMIGGMSWESSAEYYRLINRGVRARLGGLHSAQSLMYSVDFAEIEALQHAGDWASAANRMIDAARRLQAGGADFLVICTNTMHKLADPVEAAVPIPLLHIADATGVRVRDAGLTRVGLLATRFTMEESFYRGRLGDRFGLDVLVPDADGRAVVHDVIYSELCAGIVNERSRTRYCEIGRALIERGAQGLILGCTEIGLLVDQSHFEVPVFDTTRIHAEAAVEAALATG